MDVDGFVDRFFPFFRLIFAINPLVVEFSALSQRFDLFISCYGLTNQSARSLFSFKSRNSISCITRQLAQYQCIWTTLLLGLFHILAKTSPLLHVHECLQAVYENYILRPLASEGGQAMAQLVQALRHKLKCGRFDSR